MEFTFTTENYVRPPMMTGAMVNEYTSVVDDQIRRGNDVQELINVTEGVKETATVQTLVSSAIYLVNRVDPNHALTAVIAAAFEIAYDLGFQVGRQAAINEFAQEVTSKLEVTEITQQ
jgi:hypothetical protein